MRFPRLAARLFKHLHARTAAIRPPDFIVGADDPVGPYLRRWYLLPRNRVLNVYLHQFLRDDDDRALHDHPWAWLSVLLSGSYIEHTIAAGGIHHRRVRGAGSLKISGPWRAHRVELIPWADPDPAPCDEYADDHTRAAILRGGSSYQPQTSHWYFPQAYRLDQHGKYLLMAPCKDRAGTVGFRCVVDAA